MSDDTFAISIIEDTPVVLTVFPVKFCTALRLLGLIMSPAAFHVNGSLLAAKGLEGSCV